MKPLLTEARSSLASGARAIDVVELDASIIEWRERKAGSVAVALAITR